MRPFAILIVVVLAAAACGREATPTVVQPSTSAGSQVVDELPAFTPAPSATNEVRWDRAANIPGSHWSGEFSAVGFDKGYLVVDGSRSIAFSRDAISWKNVRPPLEGGVIDGIGSVVTDGRSVVVLGGYSPCREFSWEMDPAPPRCRLRPISWVSNDGLSWRSSGRWAGPVAPDDYFGSHFSAAWSVPTGGWDATETFFASNESEGDGQALWHSDDGLRWSRLRAGPANPRFQWGVADADGRRIASSAVDCIDPEQGGKTTLWTSSNGRDYEPVANFPGACPAWIRAGLAPTGVGPWVLLGMAKSSGPDDEPLAWTSPDLDTWTTSVVPVLPDMVNTVVWALAHHGSGYVATGEVDEARQFVTWLSDDGKMWRVAEARAAAGPGDIIYTVADGPAGMVGFGCGDALCEGPTTVWILAEVK
jgi:hypothetical protein